MLKLLLNAGPLEGAHTDKIGARFASVVPPFLAQHLDMGGK